MLFICLHRFFLYRTSTSSNDLIILKIDELKYVLYDAHNGNKEKNSQRRCFTNKRRKTYTYYKPPVKVGKISTEGEIWELLNGSFSKYKHHWHTQDSKQSIGKRCAQTHPRHVFTFSFDPIWSECVNASAARRNCVVYCVPFNPHVFLLLKYDSMENICRSTFVLNSIFKGNSRFVVINNTQTNEAVICWYFTSSTRQTGGELIRLYYFLVSSVYLSVLSVRSLRCSFDYVCVENVSYLHANMKIHLTQNDHFIFRLCLLLLPMGK